MGYYYKFLLWKAFWKCLLYFSLVLVTIKMFNPSPSLLDHGCHPNIKIVHSSLQPVSWNSAYFYPGIFLQSLDCDRFVMVDCLLQVTPEEVASGVKLGQYGGHGFSVIGEIWRPHGQYCLRYSTVRFGQWGVRHPVETQLCSYQPLSSSLKPEWSISTASQCTVQGQFSLGDFRFLQKKYRLGFLKESVYNDHPDSIEKRKANNRREIRRISRDMLERVLNTFNVRVAAVIQQRGVWIKHFSNY